MRNLMIIAAFLTCSMTAMAQESASDSVQSHAKGNNLSVGGYGEMIYSRNFHSDSPFRYSSAAAHKSDPSHGRFDIPHAVIYLNYDFGHGWTFNTEIEFEHGGSGGAVEQENEEAGEWETETEKGGEVELEQFWIQKSFGKAFNVRAGHIIVPVGLTNAHHEPLNFFTCYRNEGESTILPCTWHQNGVALWGRAGDFRYELQMTSGLDAFMFNRENWINLGANSPYEFEVANKYGFAARIDNYSVKGLRLGLSGYHGNTMHNSFPHDMENPNSKYKDLKGSLWLGSFDFTYKGHNIIARGNADYGYVGDSKAISALKRNSTAGNAPYQKQGFGAHAMAVGVEAGYDVFSQIPEMKAKKQRLYLFGHYEYYDSYVNAQSNQYTKKQVFTGGVNYYPMPQIVVKGEYSLRKYKAPYNNEPSLNIGIAYQGFFL